MNACVRCLLPQEDLSRSQLSALRQLQRSVSSHKVTRHEPLEALARGLLKHVMDDRTDQEQLPSMLKYVVKQAALQTHTAPAAGSAAAGSSNGAGSSSAASSVGAGSSRAAAEGGSSGSSSGSSSKAGRDQLPAGESSLTDTELLMVLEQLAAAKASEEQLALYQVGSAMGGAGERGWMSKAGWVWWWDWLCWMTGWVRDSLKYVGHTQLSTANMLRRVWHAHTSNQPAGGTHGGHEPCSACGGTC
jgi:hypothetical protein